MFNRVRMNWDAFGVCASTLCLVHCLAFPLLVALLLPQRAVEDGALGTNLSIANRRDNRASRNARRCDAPDGAGGDAAANCAATGSLPCCENEDRCAVTGKRPLTDAEHAATAGCCSTPFDKGIHAWLLGAVALVGMIALTSGYRRHRRSGVMALGIGGIVLLLVALLVGHDIWNGRGEQMLTVMGSVGMVSAHFWNRRQCRCCRFSNSNTKLALESPE